MAASSRSYCSGRGGPLCTEQERASAQWGGVMKLGFGEANSFHSVYLSPQENQKQLSDNQDFLQIFLSAKSLIHHCQETEESLLELSMMLKCHLTHCMQTSEVKCSKTFQCRGLWPCLSATGICTVTERRGLVDLGQSVLKCMFRARKWFLFCLT